MRFRDPLDTVLGSRSRVRILRHLARTRAERTGREIARDVRIDHKAISAALGALVDEGVILRRVAGRAHLYKINADHALVANLLLPCFEREGDLLTRYVEDLNRLLPRLPLSIVLFGSVARGEESARSDVDIMVVTAARIDDDLDAAAVALAARYGSMPQFIVRHPRELARGLRRGDPLLREIARTGRVVFGRSIDEVVRRGA